MDVSETDQQEQTTFNVFNKHPKTKTKAAN